MPPMTLPVPAASDSSPISLPGPLDDYFSRLTSGSPARWKLTTVCALLALIIIWGVSLHVTWAKWGSLPESTPAMRCMFGQCSRKGRCSTGTFGSCMVLLRPILEWSPFSPLRRALKRTLLVRVASGFRISHLSISCRDALEFLAGRLECGSRAAFRAFHPTIFCFPLPYSYNSVYGCLTACLFIWLMVSACTFKGWGWMVAAGMAAAAALLIKLEFGTACYATLGLLIVVRGLQQRSWRCIARDVVAILPGVVACAAVIRWMISIAGVDFILQENFMSWPTSYFMKIYGKFWLAQTGFDLSVPAFRGAARFTFIFLGFWQGLHLLLTWRRENWRWILARAVFFFVAVGYFLISVPGDDFLRPIFFPQDMLLYVMAGAVASLLYFLFHWRQRDSQGASGLILLSIFSSLLAFRILLDVTPWQYAIYYNGPVVLSFLLLLRPLIPQQGTDRRAVFLAELLICLGCVAVPALYTRRIVKISTGWVPLTTERGTIFARPVQVEQYRAAVRFMQEKGAKGEAVLSIPEDVSLYFFSETHCPTRVLAFTPGVLVPGKMTKDTIRQIEQKPVRYLVWFELAFSPSTVLPALEPTSIRRWATT